MTRKLLGVMLGLGLIVAAMSAADFAYGQIGIGIGVGGGGGPHGGPHGGGYYHGGGGYHGGGSYYGGYIGGGGVGFGANIPLSSDGSVRLGIGTGGYYSPHYYERYHYHPYGGYYYDDDNYYRGTTEYYQPRSVQYADQTPPEPPPIPTAGQISRFSDEQLAGLLRAACEVFTEELGEYSNGDGWKKRFKLTEILELAKKSRSATLDAAERATVEEVLKRTESDAKNAEYEVITKTWGFRALQAGLREFALPPAGRQAHLLVATVQKLNDSLDGLTTGAGWKKHLRLDDLKGAAENASADDPGRAKKLEGILAKFDAAAQNPEFKVVADLDGFAATRTVLQRYINALQTDKPAQTPAPPPPASETPAESAKSF